MDREVALSDLNNTNINALTPIASTPAEVAQQHHKKQPPFSKHSSLSKPRQERAPFGADYFNKHGDTNRLSAVREISGQSIGKDQSAGSFSRPDLSDDVEPTSDCR